MSTEVDELFGAGAGLPEPRRRLILGLLVGGLLLAVLGMVCTAVPGALVVLGAYAVVDKELDRVESGYLPADVRPELRRLQRWVVAGIVAVLGLMLVQGWLLAEGFYTVLWATLLAGLFQMLGVGAPPVA